MRKPTSRPPRAQLLAMRRIERELSAKTTEITERLEQLAGRLHELDPAELDQLKRQIDLQLMLFEHPGPESMDGKADKD
ncbi:hypothetical protein [Rubrivivax albus]|nr:hypothetical protein [Rubrivivax albus]